MTSLKGDAQYPLALLRRGVEFVLTVSIHSTSLVFGERVMTDPVVDVPALLEELRFGFRVEINRRGPVRVAMEKAAFP